MAISVRLPHRANARRTGSRSWPLGHEPSTLETHTLVSDLVIGESPRWHEDRVWFCHWREHEIIAVDTDGHSEVITRDPTTGPHSIERLPDGRLLIVPASEERKGILLRQEPNGSLVTHADLRELSNRWNEIVVDGRGNIYINEVGFDFMAFLSGKAEFAPGIIALVTARRLGSPGGRRNRVRQRHGGHAGQRHV